MNLAVILTIIISVLAVAIFVGVGFLVRETRAEDSEQKYWKDAYKEANSVIKKLTLKEKISLLYGTENMKEITPVVPEAPYKTKKEQKQFLCVGKVDNFTSQSGLYFNGMCLQDGPSGVRFAEGTSISYQASSNTAATWNKELFYEVGKSQGEENYEKGINVMLGPCMNMMRNPQGGRIWEGFGEDPYLSGIAATEVTKGIQSTGVIACIKHFVANDQETYRKASSSNMDMATLMDIYVEPFYRAIRYGHAASAMASYNAINSTYVYESKLLLTHILREICGFQGFVVSDWWEVVSNTTATIEAGLDMSMPGGYDEGPYSGDLYKHIGRENSYWAPFEQYVYDGILGEDVITRAATRILAAMYLLKQKPFEKGGYPKIDLYKETKTDARKEVQRQAATESQVLLKNEGNILPLDITKLNGKEIAIIGSDAKDRSNCNGEGDLECKTNNGEVYDGHMPIGYGSGTTTFGYLIDPLSAIKERVQDKGITIKESVELSCQTEDKSSEGKSSTYKTSGVEDITAATAILSTSTEVAIIFLSAISGEEYVVLEGTIGDRPNLDVMHEGNKLVEAIYKLKEDDTTKTFKIIVVINAPSAVNLPWKDKVDAIIFSGFPGAESGNAIADVLFGIENPSGHLPFTWALKDEYGSNIPELENQNAVSGGTFKSVYRYNGVDSVGRKDDKAGHGMLQVEYEDGLYIGQRWFNKMNKKPIYPFGYGLSYTTFSYSDLNLKMKNEGLEAKFKVKNEGSVVGKAVPMLFLTFPDNVGEYPKYILKGFEKVEIKAGETKEVTIIADEHALSYFNVEKDNYIRVCRGKIKAYIGENGDPDQAKLSGEVKATNCE